MDHPLPWLSYVDANDLEDKNKSNRFAGMEVDDPDGEKLGKVEGFIVDVDTGRPFHVVVDAGHWFKHKHVLLPVGRVMLDESGRKMTASVGKNRVSRFPGFDKDKFARLSKDELRELAQSIATESGTPDEGVVAVEWVMWSDYAYPSWWETSYYRPGSGATRDEAGVTKAQQRASAADRNR
jgi:sporulation protein YlmC with PRC-barrel domain